MRVKASRSAFDQDWLIATNTGSPYSMRRYSLIRQSPLRITARSSGIPTDRFDRRVESIDSSTAFLASRIVVSGVTTRSRIGLPYLCSPICRKGVSGVASMWLPSG